MAGKDDLKLLSAYIYTKVKGLKDPEDDIHAIGAVVMNRATSLGSLPEAIQTMSPTPDLINVIQGQISGRGEKEYKRVIQLTSKMLRGSADPTGGAVELAPKRSKVDPSLGLVKTHATKHHNFYKPSGGMSNMPKAIV